MSERAPSFPEAEQHEVGRFTGSTAQAADLIPTAAMLAKHRLQCRIMPARYANKARVSRVFDLLGALQLILLKASAALAADPSALGPTGWEAFRSL